MAGDVKHKVVRLTERGVACVLDGQAGMTFIVIHFTGLKLDVAAVRDYRYPGDHYPYQVWSLGRDDYEMVD